MLRMNDDKLDQENQSLRLKGLITVRYEEGVSGLEEYVSMLSETQCLLMGAESERQKPDGKRDAKIDLVHNDRHICGKGNLREIRI